ncbi:hypothetical protein [Halpernia sp. GG3]
MKKLVIGLTFAAAGLISTANAQIQKGNWMVGGEIGGANFGLNKGAGYNVKITPQAAYFVENNWAVGPYVNLGFSGAKGASTIFNYGVGALSRYYFSPGEQGIDSLLKHGRSFVEGNAGIGGTTISNGGASANGLDLGVGTGYTYFITQNIGLDASVKLNGNLGFGNRGTTSAVGFRLGLNIFLPAAKAMSNVKSEM